MYEFLTGRLVTGEPEEVVLDVNGVGYCCAVSGATASRLVGLGEEQTLFVRHVVRDDKALLFGFVSREERSLFDALCSVSKVGPSTALSLLSALDPGTLAAAVEADDSGLLSKVKGIGKRTAERLCVELRGKLDAGVAAPLPGKVTDRSAAVIAALTALGFPRRPAAAVAAEVLADQPADAPLEELVKRGLAALSAKPGSTGRQG